ncbi:DnaD domain-containing protein [Chloroflexota bacterium]
MKQFSGFPAKAQFTPIHNVFFSSLLSQISDIAELKITLHIFWLLYSKRGYPRFTTYRELLGSANLISGLKEGIKPPDEVLRSALKMAVKRGTILHVVLKRDRAPEDVYFLNTQSDRQVVVKVQNGELDLVGLKTGGQAYPDIEIKPQPDIFTLYEQNIGMLTPMVAEELQEAEKLYPEAWIKDAIKEAVNQNIRKKSYILAILERWVAEGRSYGAHQRAVKKTNPDKYGKQKYGHMVKH